MKTVFWIAGLLAAGSLVYFVILPQFAPSRNAEYRLQCKNNMKWIGIGMHNFHDRHLSFPPAFIADADGNAMHSWRVQILPHLELNELNGYSELIAKYDFDEPWNSPKNLAIQDQIPEEYRCPSFAATYGDGETEFGPASRLANYQVINTPGGMFDGSKRTRFRDLYDGSSNTICVTDVCNTPVHWMEPKDTSVEAFLSDWKSSTDASTANHIDGVQVLLGDGSTTVLHKSIDESVLQKLLTKAGGEVIDTVF